MPKHLAEFLEVQKERGNLIFRHLGPMDIKAVAEMVAAIFPGLDKIETFIKMVYRKSHGIPLLAVTAWVATPDAPEIAAAAWLGTCRARTASG